jgi:hypothetical protein
MITLRCGDAEVAAPGSGLEDGVAVVAEKVIVRLGQFFGQANRLALEGNEVLLKGRLWKEVSQAFAQDQSQRAVERDEAGIECGVVKRGEAKAVARVQAMFREFAPRLDVARHKQPGNVDAADAATNVVGVENRLPEKLLSAPDFNGRLNLRWAGRGGGPAAGGRGKKLD